MHKLALAFTVLVSSITFAQEAVELERPSPPPDAPVLLSDRAPATGLLVRELRTRLVALRARWVETNQPGFRGPTMMFISGGFAGTAGIGLLIANAAAPKTFSSIPIAVPIVLLAVNAGLAIGAPFLVNAGKQEREKFDAEPTPYDADLAAVNRDSVTIDVEATQARLTELRVAVLVDQRDQLLSDMPGRQDWKFFLGTPLAAVGAGLAVLCGIGTSSSSGTGGVVGVLISAFVVLALIVCIGIGVTGLAFLISGVVGVQERNKRIEQLRELEDKLPFSQREALPDGR